MLKGQHGTGKTLAALYYAAKNYVSDRHTKIIVIRTPVESGTDKIGFLPSSLAEKCEPHFVSAKDALDKLLNAPKVEADMNGPNQRICFKIPNFALGVTFTNAVVIIDESQMIQPLIMKLLLERIGENCKVIVLGDQSQIYTKDVSRNGLRDALSKFFITEVDEKTGKLFVGDSKYEDIGYFKFDVEDMQRSDIVKTVVTAYTT